MDTFDLSEILEHTTTSSSIGTLASSSSSTPPQRHAYMHQLFKRIDDDDDDDDNNHLESADQRDNLSTTRNNPSLSSEHFNSSTNNAHPLFSECSESTQNHNNQTITNTSTAAPSPSICRVQSKPGGTIRASLHGTGIRATPDVHQDELVNQYDTRTNLKNKSAPRMLSSQTKLILEDISSYLDSPSSSSSSSSTTSATSAADKIRETAKLHPSSSIDPTVSSRHTEPQAASDPKSKPTFYFSGSSVCHGYLHVSNHFHGEGEGNERRLFKRKRFMQG